MSDPGFGKPVDPLDQICKQYKDCQKCVRREYGDECIGEFVKYDWRMRRGAPQCQNAPGTCERNLCECDLDFARKMPGQYEVFDAKYHLFWSEEGWEPKDSCEKVSFGVVKKGFINRFYLFIIYIYCEFLIRFFMFNRNSKSTLSVQNSQ